MSNFFDFLVKRNSKFNERALQNSKGFESGSSSLKMLVTPVLTNITIIEGAEIINICLKSVHSQVSKKRTARNKRTYIKG
jgi:hypothetical protein